VDGENHLVFLSVRGKIVLNGIYKSNLWPQDLD